tara:strand:+ start:6685 stop:7326 length:642 start_codon:yes stop_codon:yes gene_type:complete
MSIAIDNQIQNLSLNVGDMINRRREILKTAYSMEQLNKDMKELDEKEANERRRQHLEMIQSELEAKNNKEQSMSHENYFCPACEPHGPDQPCDPQDHAIEHADYLMLYTLPMSSIPKRDPENIRQALIKLIRDGIKPATLATELIRWPVNSRNLSKELWKKFKNSAPRNFCPTCETEVELIDRDGENEVESLVDGKIYCSAKCLNFSIKQWDQ